MVGYGERNEDDDDNYSGDDVDDDVKNDDTGCPIFEQMDFGHPKKDDDDSDVMWMIILTMMI